MAFGENCGEGKAEKPGFEGRLIHGGFQEELPGEHGMGQGAECDGQILPVELPLLAGEGQVRHSRAERAGKLLPGLAVSCTLNTNPKELQGTGTPAINQELGKGSEDSLAQREPPLWNG